MRLSKALPGLQIRLPLFSMAVSAGAPTTVDDHIEETLDIARLLVKRPQSTFFVKVEGESMIDASINPGDILVVDRSVEAHHNDIVIAILEGEFTVKVLHRIPQLKLVSRNSRQPISMADPFQVWGVVLWVIHKAHN